MFIFYKHSTCLRLQNPIILNTFNNWTKIEAFNFPGRATIERNGNRHPANRNSAQQTDNGITEMRITANPLNYNYVDPEDAIRENGNVMVTSFDNPNSIELPSQNDKKVIDSTTYCKKSSRHARHHSGDGHWQ